MLRRNFVTGIVAGGLCAPSIVRASSLMPVRRVIWDFANDSDDGLIRHFAPIRLEEFGSAPQSVQAASYQLILDGRPRAWRESGSLADALWWKSLTSGLIAGGLSAPSIVRASSLMPVRRVIWNFSDVEGWYPNGLLADALWWKSLTSR